MTPPHALIVVKVESAYAASVAEVIDAVTDASRTRTVKVVDPSSVGSANVATVDPTLHTGAESGTHPDVNVPVGEIDT